MVRISCVSLWISARPREAGTAFFIVHDYKYGLYLNTVCKFTCFSHVSLHSRCPSMALPSCQGILWKFIVVRPPTRRIRIIIFRVLSNFISDFIFWLKTYDMFLEIPAIYISEPSRSKTPECVRFTHSFLSLYFVMVQVKIVQPDGSVKEMLYTFKGCVERLCDHYHSVRGPLFLIFCFSLTHIFPGLGSGKENT